MNKFENFIFIKELERFCEEHLIDLLDKDYKLDISEVSTKNSYKVVISNFKNPIAWESLSQYLLQFLEIITDDYIIKPMEVETKSIFKDIAINGKGLSIDEILNTPPLLLKRKIENMTVSNLHIKSIWFHIKGKVL